MAKDVCRGSQYDDGDDNIGKGHDTRSLLQIIDVQIVADARRQPPFAYSIEYIMRLSQAVRTHDT